MSTFTLTFNTDGAAFEEDPTIEIARLLREAAQRVDGAFFAHGNVMRLKDINGNRVGFFVHEDEVSS